MFNMILQIIEATIDNVYRKYKHMMTELSYLILKDSQLAEDNVQESLIRINNNLSKMDDLESSRSKNYIYTIVKNSALNMLEKRKDDLRAYNNPDIVENLPDRITSYELHDEYGFSEEVSLTLSELSEKDKDIIVFRYAYGLSFKEIGKTLDMSASGVLARCKRIEKDLRKSLVMRGEQ